MYAHQNDNKVNELRRLLKAAVDNDQDYTYRYGLVLKAMAAANDLGYATGYRIDPNEPEWPVAFIELPTGQVSWHMPQHSAAWDGHSTEEKFERIQQY